MEEENTNKRKIVIPMALGIAVLTILVLGATYAYFTVGTSNNFGSKTISATTPEIGSVTLSSGDSLSLNMTSELMMQKWTYNGRDFYNSEAECEAAHPTPGNVNSKLETYEINNLMPQNEVYKPSLMVISPECYLTNREYYATTTGTPSTTLTEVDIATATVTGSGNFNCTYDLTITSSATNSLYTAFTGMTGHDAGQIVLKVGSHAYDFNTTDFSSPITVNESFNNITSSASKSIKASLMFNNTNFDQNALQGKDITLTFTASNLSCTAIEAPNVLYYTYDANAEETGNGKITSKLASPDATWQYYIKETRGNVVAGEDTWAIFESGVLNTSYGTFAGQSACQTFINGAPSTITCGEISGETYQSVTGNETCAIFNGEEVCLKPNDYANVGSYYTRMNNLGLTCNDYQNENKLRCSNGTTYNEPGSLFCNLSDDGLVYCGLLDGSRCTVFDSSYAVCEY